MNMTYKPFAVALLCVAPVVHAQSSEEVPATDTGLKNAVLWDISNSGSVVDNYAQLDLALSEHVSSMAALSQASDGTQAYALGLHRNSKTGWLGVNYKSLTASNDVSTQTYSANIGRIAGNWDYFFSPSYVHTSVFSQTGMNKSSAVSAPGISLGLSHRGEKTDVGINGGMNFYTKLLDSYVSDSRRVGNVNLQSELSTTGLEKSYWGIYLKHYQSWGNWGLDYLNSTSAVDLSHSQFTSARMSYYIGQQWDLRLALVQADYSGVIQNRVSVGAKFYW